MARKTATQIHLDHGSAGASFGVVFMTENSH